MTSTTGCARRKSPPPVPKGPSPLRGRVGRRPGKVDTRAEIVEAARAVFGDAGYDRASLRAIARRAGVDPALVHHYFADKAQLFMASMELPADPRSVALAAGVERGFDGTRVVEQFLAQWERPGVAGSPSFVATVQAVAGSPRVAEAIAEFLTERLPAFGPPDEDGGRSRQRRALVSSQLVGLGWARYVMRYEPLASSSRAEVARWVGPTLERYAFGDLPAVRRAPRSRLRKPDDEP